MIWSFCLSQKYTNYSTKDGLPSNHVYTILQDAKGFMWFLTDKGMVKYNGKTFKTFTTKNGLPTSDIWEAFTTPDGKIWPFSKSNHLGFIENDTVISFPTKNKEIISPTHSSQVKNSIFPAGANKTYILKDSVWQAVDVPSTIGRNVDFSKLIHNKVNFLSHNYTNSTIDIFDKTNKLIKNFPFLEAAVINCEARGQLNDSLCFWVNNSRYSILNLNNLKITNRDFKDEIGISYIKYPRINLVNNSIQVTGNHFVGVLDETFRIKTSYYFPEDLKSHFGFIDKSNSVWLATFDNGVYKLSYNKQSIDYKFLEEKIQNITRVNDTILVNVFNKGYFKYNNQNKTFTHFIKEEDYTFGISKVKELKTTFYSFRNKIISKKDKKTSVLDLGFFKKYVFNNNELARKLVYYNDVLYGNYSFGIHKINPETLDIEKEYPQLGINDIVVFDDTLIVATSNGIRQLKNEAIIPIHYNDVTFNKSVLSIQTLNTNQLLVNTDGFGSYITDLKTILPLKGSEFLSVQNAHILENKIWLATNSGVLYYKKTANNYKLIRHYTINDGLPSNIVNTVFTSETKLLVGTNTGLAILPINQKKQDLLLDVFVEKANYNSQSLTHKGTVTYQSDATLHLEANAIDFCENTTTTFAYKLEPIQNQWNTTETNSFNFSSLEPKSYTFYVKSGTKETQFNFTIAPLWWQLFWVRLLAIVLAIVIIAYVFWRLSKAQQDKKNKKLIQEKQLSEIQLKALRSQMNPHFVFNSLAAIQYYINNNEVEASEAYLVKFSKLIRQFFELSKETEITIEDEAKLITNYLDIEKLRFKDKFEYIISVDKKINKNISKLPTMLIQPIVENAINHGVFNKIENGNVSINFISNEAKSIKIEIIDDGVGFVNTLKTSSKKIKSSNVLENRLKFLNQSGLWNISYSEEELHPELSNKGNKSTFVITQL